MSEHTVVVALDGSELAEKTVPYAIAIARATGAGLHLVKVWEEGERAMMENLAGSGGSAFKQGEEYWERYIAGLADNADSEGIDIGTDVIIGGAAEEILNLIDRLGASYLVIATHGRSGLSRWHYGSVASRLVREAPVPTLVVGPAVLEADQGKPAVRRVLVPLDGSPLAETALEPALDLAGRFDAELVLAQALQWATQAFIFGVPEVNIAQVDEDLTNAAKSYLANVKDRLKAGRRVETAVLHGPPADALISLVSKQEIDLVVMTSHARTGIARAVLGSIADRLLQGDAPVLLIRPAGAAASDEHP